MKKFFTLIAAVALAASVKAQTTYSFENLSQDNFEYSEDEYKWDTTGKKFDLLKASKSEYYALSLKNTPVSFKYKNSKTKEIYLIYLRKPCFVFKRKVFCSRLLV